MSRGLWGLKGSMIYDDKACDPFLSAIAEAIVGMLRLARRARRQHVRDMGRWADDGGPA